MNQIRVSVVIPTIGRIEQLDRAIRSVLQQTYPIHEVIIVVDGSSEEVKKLCSVYQDDCVKVFETLERKGGSFVRNYGIQKSTGEWIALLDDDDEWFETKIEKQMKLVEKNRADLVFTSVVTTNQAGRTYQLPRKKWDKSETLGDYLFLPYWGRTGGFIQTSTILASKQLFLDYPFTNGLVKHQDWDWLVKIQEKDDLNVCAVEEALSFYYRDTTQSVGKVNRWKFSYEWIKASKDKLSRDAFEHFCLIMVLPDMLRDEGLADGERRKCFRNLVKEISMKNRFSMRFLKVIWLELRGRK